MKRSVSNFTDEVAAQEVVSELREKMSAAGFDEQYLKDFFADPIKINSLIKSFQLKSVSTGNDCGKIEILPGRSSNKIVYLVRVNEESRIADKEGNLSQLISCFPKHYLVSELTIGGAILEFVGFDATEIFALQVDEGKNPEEIKDKLRDTESVLDFVNEHGLKVSSMIYPWNRVMSIENLFYKLNKK